MFQLSVQLFIEFPLFTLLSRLYLLFHDQYLLFWRSRSLEAADLSSNTEVYAGLSPSLTDDSSAAMLFLSRGRS